MAACLCQIDVICNRSCEHLKVKVTQSGLILCGPMGCSLPGSSVHGILQARILQWVALPNLGIKPRSPGLQAHSLPSEPPGKPNRPCTYEESKDLWKLGRQIFVEVLKFELILKG